MVAFLCCFARFFLPFPPIFESSTGLENALKNCSHTCFSILALRQENAYGKTLGNNSPGNRSSMGAVESSQGRSQLASIGSSCPVEMGKRMEVLNWRMEDKILSLCVFPGSWCPAVCCSFPWILVSSYSWQHGESVGGINGAASAEMSLVTGRTWQYWEKKMKESL